MEREFRDEYAEVTGAFGLARLWMRTLMDFALSALLQVLREIGQDARHALRIWAHRPIYAVFAIAALAIGIGANTGVFSVLNGLLLRSLPFYQADRLALLWMFSPTLGNSPGEFHAWRTQSAYLDDAARYGTVEVNLDAGREAARIRLTETSWNFFFMLGSRPVLGRAFAPEEDTAGRDSVAVIGYGLWQQLFGGDAKALGATIRVNGVPLTVIGVAPPGFDYPQRTLVWSPTMFDVKRIPKTGVFFRENIGRLKRGLSRAQARQAFEAEARRQWLQRPHADSFNRPALVPIQEHLAGPVKKASVILMGGVALILLIACVNLANLMLARTLDRSNELTIRAALGASRGRLTQQLLTESVLMCLIAALAGLFVAAGAVRVVGAVQPAPLTAQAYTILDWRVLAFAIAVSVVTGVLFGVVPALHVGRTSSSIFVRSSTSNPRVSRTRNALIAAQIALTVILLTGSIALGRAFVALFQVDTGYGVRGVATMSVSLAGTRYEGSRATAYCQEALQRVREVPGVLSASATQFLPLNTSAYMVGEFQIDERGTATPAVVVPIAPEFFRTMGGRVLYGREFAAQDGMSSEGLAIVNGELARNFGDPRDALGRYVTDLWGKPCKIIGVVQGMRYAGPSFTAGPQVFFLIRSPSALTVVAKVGGNPRAAIARIRDAAQSVDPKIPVFNVKTMEERLDETLARPKFYAAAMLFFGGFAVLLAVIGVYGVVSYAVMQRTHEMGIRLALGTTPPRLRRALLGRGMITVAIGAAPGILGAVPARAYLQNLVEGAGAVTASTALMAAIIVSAVAAAGIWLATRGIARLDITEIVRAE